MSPFCASSAGGCHWIMISDSDLNRTNTYIHLPSLKKYFFNFNPPCRPHEPQRRPRGRLLRQHHPLGGQGGGALAHGVDGGDAEDVRGGGSIGEKTAQSVPIKIKWFFLDFFTRQDFRPIFAININKSRLEGETLIDPSYYYFLLSYKWRLYSWAGGAIYYPSVFKEECLYLRYVREQVANSDETKIFFSTLQGSKRLQKSKTLAKDASSLIPLPFSSRAS